MTSQADRDGQAIMEIALSNLEKYSEQEKTVVLAELVLYLWILSSGSEHSAENIALYLGRRSIKILIDVSRDLAAMKRAQEESP